MEGMHLQSHCVISHSKVDVLTFGKKSGISLKSFVFAVAFLNSIETNKVIRLTGCWCRVVVHE